MNLKKMSRVAVVTTLVLGVTTIVYSFPRLPREIALWMQPPIDPPESSLGFLSNGPNSNAGALFPAAEDFSITDSSTPTQLGWQGFYSYDTPAGDLTPRWFQIRIWKTAPNGLPKTQIYTLNRYVSVSNSGTTNAYGEPIYFYNTTLPNVSTLVPGNYWVSIVENDPETDLAWWWSDSDNTDINPDLNHQIAFRNDVNSPWQFFYEAHAAAFLVKGNVK